MRYGEIMEQNNGRITPEQIERCDEMVEFGELSTRYLEMAAGNGFGSVIELQNLMGLWELEVSQGKFGIIEYLRFSLKYWDDGENLDDV